MKLYEKGEVNHKTFFTKESSYNNKINANDFKQIALILLDLENNGLNINGAILEYKRMKEEGKFPW